MRTSFLLIAAAVALASVEVRAQGVGQVRPPVPVTQRDSIARRDSLARRDSTKDSLIVKWVEPDSVMRSLLARPGYDVSRYQGMHASFDAATKSLMLLADSGRLAQVERGKQIAVSDSALSYVQGARTLIRSFGHYQIYDPTSTQAPYVRGFGDLVYDLNESSATIPNATLSVTNGGDTWQLAAKRVKIFRDTTKGGAETLYAGGLTMTSCPDSVPHFFIEVERAKRYSNKWLFGRPARLFLTNGEDSASAVPVLWLPFFFQAPQGGRHSGILTPRFGVSDIVRNNPAYRRNIENLGYYWSINDYMNATFALDWRSAGGGDNAGIDPGWLRYQGDWDYKWLDRFVDGGIRMAYTHQGDRSTNLAVTWNHDQRFAHNAQLRMGINYAKNTRLQRQNTFDPMAATATIRSEVSYSRRFGPLSFNIGGQRSQYPGRDQVDQAFPTVSLTSETVKLLGDKVSWTPAISYSASSSVNLDQPGPFSFLFTGPRDSTRLKRSAYGSSLTIQSPLVILGWNWVNSLTVRTQRSDFPQQFTMYDVLTGDSVDTRIFGSTFRTDIDWNPGIQLPSLAKVGYFNRFKITPFVAFANVDAGPFMIKTERTEGRWARQSKRITTGVSTAPTIYGLFPGMGPFTRFQHVISPMVGYSWAPRASISDDYLRATGRTRKGYLGALPQSSVSFGVSQSLNAKVRPADSTQKEGDIKLLGITMSSFSYDFRRADTLKATNSHWWRGLTTERMALQLRSDLVPGVDFSMDYSLFQGSTSSDTAQFKPYRENVSASFTIGRGQNPLAILARLFAVAVPEGKTGPVSTQPPPPNTPPDEQQKAQELTAQPVAGSRTGARSIIAPGQGGWRASLTLSSARPRPPAGGNVIEFDPRVRCEQLAGKNPFILDQCLAQARANPTGDLPLQSGIAGAQVYRIPARTNVGGDLSFNLTPACATSWRTNYDFERHEFAQHTVSLQRDMHDWRSIFSFTQSPNGNFAFSFMVGLKAEPDFKFEHNKASVRSGQVF